MALGALILKMGTQRSAVKFERATKKPIETQREKLRSIIRKNKDTEYGKRYGFDSIVTVSDYQRQVPVVKYEDISDDVDKVVEGKKNVLTAEMPVMFAQTSGTTGKPKYIPITPTCRRRQHGDVARTWVYNMVVDHPEFASGKIVSLVSPAVEGYTESGIPFGSTSGSIYRDMPAIVHKSYAIPYEAFEISNYQAKYYAIMRIGIEQAVSLICSANPSSILKMCEKANEFSEDIIRDIHDGSLSDEYEIDTNIRKHLAKTLKPNPARSDFLEKIRSRQNGILKPADYWPRLSLIACWKGGTVGHYLEKFPRWFNPDGIRQIPVRDWGYLASEVRGSIPVTDEGSAGILTISTNFFEFVKVEDLMSNPQSTSSWTFLTVEHLEDGKEYYIFITTTGGLYRYDMNDIVRVEGYHNSTPQIVFVRKGRGVTNITGEKVSVDQIIDAIGYASEKTNAIASHFKAEADAEQSRYVFRVEFIEHISEELGRDFLISLDEYLMSINIEYKAKRDSMRLARPVLHVMREGWYEHGRRQLIENGSRTFQIKTQVLSAVTLQIGDIKRQLEQVIEI